MAKKKKNSDLKMLVAVLAVVAVVAVIVLFLILQPSDGNADKGNISGDIVGDNIKGTDNSTKKDLIAEADLPDATTPVQETNETGTTKITFVGMTANIEGSGAKLEGNMLKIVRGGIYELSGTFDDGRIVVRADGEDVVLILNGVNVTCSDSAPLFVNKAESVTLVLNGTTENVFSDGSSYDYTLEYCDAIEEEPNACIYSKDDLIIRGTGSLVVNANFNSGIKSNDDLEIVNTTVNVNAKNHGINGKDSLIIQNSTVKVISGGDGLRSTQDTDPTRGYANFSGSNIYVTSTEDSIQVETGLTIDNCSISLTAGGGYKALSTTSSAKGIKVNQGYAVYNSGTMIINSRDDGFNVLGDINLNGGKINISTADDGIHSDSAIYINCDMLTVENSLEGIEGMSVTFSGGYTYVNATDDGINTAGGADNEEFDWGGMNPFIANENNYIEILDGHIVVNANGDGVDSNGSIYLTGGTLIVNGPTNSANGALDYAGDFYLDGGTLLAMGAAGMAQVPDNPSQYCLSLTFDETLREGDLVNISNGDSEFTIYIAKSVSNIVFSSPDIVGGTTYEISYGGKYSGGEIVDGICTGGKYSGGKKLCELNTSDYLVAYGRVGIGGSMGGGMFGDPGMSMGGRGEGKGRSGGH